jgi:cytochrome b pre-mRNA-processing protein 3
MFVDMDHALRESGVGDLSVGKHMRRMMKAFNGRMAAYEAGLADAALLAAALRRNVYGTVGGEIDTRPMAEYLHRCVNTVQSAQMPALLAGDAGWADADQARAEDRSA